MPKSPQVGQQKSSKSSRLDCMAPEAARRLVLKPPVPVFGIRRSFGSDITNMLPSTVHASAKERKAALTSKVATIKKPSSISRKTPTKLEANKQASSVSMTATANSRKTPLEVIIDKRQRNNPQAAAAFHRDILHYLEEQEVVAA